MIFIFATDMEAAPFRRLAPHATIEICGVGMAECAAQTTKIIERHGAQQTYILAGIAGSYSISEVAIGECVEVVREAIEELPAAFSCSYENQPLTSLRSVTSNTVNRAAQTSRSQIENMEGAAFFALCSVQGVKCAEIRAISNKVGDPFEEWSVAPSLERLAQELIKL